MTIKTILQNEFSEAIVNAFGKDYALVDPLIKPVNPPHFGDYQANFAMRLAKEMGQKPTEVAEKVGEELNHPEIFQEFKVSGPGFINVLLADSFLEQQLQAILEDPRLGVVETKTSYPTIVEYGSPNVAKEMHVGHLRSTIIGDAIARTLTFLGHQVIRQNHVGDWGTQFGMLIEYMMETKWTAKQHTISEASALYKEAKKRFDADPEFATKAREKVVALQQRDPVIIDLWQRLVAESERHFQEVYQRLGVLLAQEDIRGESFYNEMLANIVTELKERGLATESEGAIVIFLPGFVDKDKKAIPFIIQKSGGGYLYATTDLAAAKFRIENLGAKRLVYIVDARQAQHFAMLFAVVKAAGWANDEIRLEHAAFGTVLGKDRKPFKTRSGESIQLSVLLDEAEKRAGEIVASKTNFSDEEKTKIAKTIGISALKYADLSNDKIRDYVFDWDRMLSFEGNTSPYLQNAYVRIKAIFRKGDIKIAQIEPTQIKLTSAYERELAIVLLEFPEVVNMVAEELAPHRLTAYLYNLASAFHKFYEHCPILSEPDKTLQSSRLLLCDLTARTLQLGLGLLGIEVLEQM